MNIFKNAFTSYKNVWIEITEETHNHGGEGWEFGTCLWSPTLGSSGKKSYEFMLKPQIEDAVLHIYLKKNVRYIFGNSIVKKNCFTTKEEPPESGKWSNRENYYRIELKSFFQFATSLDIKILLKEYSNDIRSELIDDEPALYPFNKYQDTVRLGQGGYLTKCTSKLFEVIREALNIEQSYKPKSNLKIDVDPHSEYEEGKRKKKEIYFFARNPKLAQDAKKLKGYICEACGLDFKKKYRELGKNFIECHHENHLSERSEKEWDNNTKTSIDNVKVLCSYCHRMIHRTKPAKKIEEIVKLIKQNNLK